MGDGSSATSRSNQDPFLGSRVVNSGLQDPENQARAPARCVLYTRALRKGVDRDIGALGLLPVCRSLEDLLVLLEKDDVDALVFDESIPEQERQHVVGWARIFKPTLVCEPKAVFARRTGGHVA